MRILTPTIEITSIGVAQVVSKILVREQAKSMSLEVLEKEELTPVILLAKMEEFTPSMIPMEILCLLMVLNHLRMRQAQQQKKIQLTSKKKKLISKFTNQNTHLQPSTMQDLWI